MKIRPEWSFVCRVAGVGTVWRLTLYSGWSFRVLYSVDPEGPGGNGGGESAAWRKAA